jgi:hypothetical protein
MKYILFFFISLNLYSQDIDYLKSQDTIYFLLPESETDLVLKEKGITYRVYGNDFINSYLFNDVDKRMIYFVTYNSDQIPGKANLKVKRKDFLKNNKNKIIDFDFIAKNGLRIPFIDILKGRKVVYIIDSKKIKKRKIILKKTVIGDGSFYIDN